MKRNAEQAKKHREYMKEYNRKHKEVLKAYYHNHKEVISLQKRNPIDRLQVKAFNSFFDEFIREYELSKEEAFLEALRLTMQDRMVRALEEKPELVQKWIDGDFEKTDKIARDYRIYKLRHIPRVGRYKVAL